MELLPYLLPYFTPTGMELLPYGVTAIVTVQNIPTCKYIEPTNIAIRSVSVQNIPARKYIAHTGIEIIFVVLQILPTGKNLPLRLQI